MQPHANLWIETSDGEVALSEWRVQLLEAIADTGSLSAAARRLNVDYRTAWRKLKEMEARLGMALTARQAGGVRGGGTRLTADGDEFVRRFRRFTRGVEALVARQFQAAFAAAGPSARGVVRRRSH